MPRDSNATLAVSLSGRGQAFVDGARVLSDVLDGGVLLREARATIALRGGWEWHEVVIKTTTHFGARHWGAWAALFQQDGKAPLAEAEVSACGPQAGTGGMCG